MHVNEILVERDVEPDVTLVEFLRAHLELTGTHVGCNNGICGSCTVLLNGEAVRACLLLAVQVDGASITTVEGLGGRQLNPLQQAFVEYGAVQCGF
ncbi:MAG TPA: 2Fe-2S iron-sulfur cluster-binding protein, partial [Chloroflexota bacterium]|nr:2Fe-2S iron-sulfur cluster-binding protein [Chloroflexota bacterium]